MKQLLVLTFFLLLGAIAAFFLQYNDPAIMPGLMRKLVLAATIDQGFLFVAAGIFTFQGAFRVQQLGGIIGVGLRLFSIGLIIFGLGFIQFPFMVFFNAWNSFYATSGLYWLAYIIGGLSMVVGLLITARRYTNKAIIALLATLVTAILFRIALFVFPYLLGGKDQPLSALRTYHTVDAIIYFFSALLFILSILLRQVFGISTVGRIFRYLVTAFFLIVILALLTIDANINGINRWYDYYGIYYFLVFFSAVSFAYFGYKLKSIHI